MTRTQPSTDRGAVVALVGTVLGTLLLITVLGSAAADG